MLRIILLLLLAATAIAGAWDFAELGYADVYDERTDVHMWLPPGYTLTNPGPEEVKALWDDGGLEGLKVNVRWVSVLGGKTPAAIEEYMTKSYGVENLVPTDARDLPLKRLVGFCAGASEGRAARYEYDDYQGVPRGALCYFVLANGKLYVFAVVWPRGNALAAEAGSRVADGFCIGPRPTVLTNPAAVVEP